MHEQPLPAAPAAYETPTITDHGTLRALTLGKPSAGGDFFSGSGDVSFSSL